MKHTTGRPPTKTETMAPIRTMLAFEHAKARPDMRAAMVLAWELGQRAGFHAVAGTLVLVADGAR